MSNSTSRQRQAPHSERHPERHLELRFAPHSRTGRSVRHEVRAFAESHGLHGPELDDFIIALGEALGNAVEHSESSGEIELRCEIHDDKILATLVDSGAGFQLMSEKPAALPDPLNERGRGLAIMRRCSDIFAVESVPGRGTAVVLGRFLRGASRLHRDAAQ